MCLSNLGQALRLVIRPNHLYVFRMVSFDVRLCLCVSNLSNLG